jgi:hypothetical protein
VLGLAKEAFPSCIAAQNLMKNYKCGVNSYNKQIEIECAGPILMRPLGPILTKDELQFLIRIYFSFYLEILIYLWKF